MDKWSKDEKDQLRAFWKSEIGEKYKKRIKDSQQELINFAMGTPDKDASLRCINIANGYESVLLDIDKMCEKEVADKKKK